VKGMLISKGGTRHTSGRNTFSREWSPWPATVFDCTSDGHFPIKLDTEQFIPKGTERHSSITTRFPLLHSVPKTQNNYRIHPSRSIQSASGEIPA
jgi:hypothetical protein